MQAIGTWRGGYRTDLDDGRTHVVTVDLPRDEGGESAGPSALELSVLSLAGCITTIFALVARKRRLGFSAMSIGLEAERPEGAPTITRVRGRFRIRTDAAEADVATALRLTVRTCPVGALFEKAGIPVEITPVVERPLTGAGAVSR
jgi:putative redox protein